MRIGIPKEMKEHEYRVAITPAGVCELTRHGHEVQIERNAGAGSSFTDTEYQSAGATVDDSADSVWEFGDLILKVKEPIAAEFHRMRHGQTLFTYLHLAASGRCAEAILDSGVTALAYETVQLDDGALPLLAPMSEVAGRLAPQVGFYHLMRHGDGRGVLPGGVPGVRPADVTVIGSGVAGFNAIQIARGMGARVTALDVSVDRLRAVDAVFGGSVITLASSALAIEGAVRHADLVIGAVLVPGARAPRLVSDDLIAEMRPGSVLVDIAIDQGGCFESSSPTTHDNPTFRVHNSQLYCVANMPGSVPRTSTAALANVTMPYALKVAELGWREAVASDRALERGLNAHAGQVTNPSVAAALGCEFVEPRAA